MLYSHCLFYALAFFIVFFRAGSFLTAAFFTNFGFDNFSCSLGFGAAFKAATAARLPQCVANLSGGSASDKASALQLFKVLGAICKASAKGAGSQSAPDRTSVV